MLVDYNSYWYVGLVILSLLLLVYVFMKTRGIQVILLFMAAVGLGYLIEDIIYDILHSYVYYPHLMPDKPYYDSNFGSFASNAFALPASAVFIAVFRKKGFWVLFFTAFFSGIEWLFLHLGIYKHNWWRTWYTAAGLPFYYGTITLLYKKIQQHADGFWPLLITILIISPVSDMMHILPIMLFSNRYYQLGWYHNIYIDTNGFAVIYSMASSLLLIFIVKLSLKQRGVKLLLVLGSTFLGNMILDLAGILHSLTWWDLYYNMILSIFIFFIAEAVSKQISVKFSNV